VVEVHHGGGFCGGTGQGLEEAAVMAGPEREETGKHLGLAVARPPTGPRQGPNGVNASVYHASGPQQAGCSPAERGDWFTFTQQKWRADIILSFF